MVDVYLDDSVRHFRETSILSGFTEFLDPGPVEGYQAIFDIPHPVFTTFNQPITTTYRRSKLTCQYYLGSYLDH